MTSRDTSVVAVHPAAPLLPAFANGTLSDEERGYVAEHLAVCAQCRQELEECEQLLAQLREVYASEPAPSPAVWRTAREGIAREQAKAPRVRWLAALDGALRSLLQPRFAPTLALALVIAQFGVLAWMLGGPERNVTEEVRTRSVAPAVVRLRIAFQPQATAADIGSLLRESGGRIVDGPDADGFYVVEMTGEAGNFASRRAALIKSVEALAPR